MAEWNWVILVGGFTGDGSADHRLFRIDGDPRVPFFKTQAAAEKFAMERRPVEPCLICRVLVEVEPSTIFVRHREAT